MRNIIISTEKAHHKQVVNSGDFYSLSNLRDLLFHVQEHRFTISEIKENLDQLGLKFCGFESNEIVSHFKKMNANKFDPYELDNWQTYEQSHTSAFVGMYQFWCQKID